MDILIVVADRSERDLLRKTLGSTEDRFLIAHPGTELAGFRFSKIILTRQMQSVLSNPPKDSPAAQRASQWWSESVLRRLTFDGRILAL